MKRVMMFLTAILLSATMFAQGVITLTQTNTEANVQNSSFKGMTETFSFSHINTFEVATQEGNFTEVIIPGLQFIGEEGEPKLPALNQIIGIPFGAEVKVTIKNYTLESYNLSDYGVENYIIPAQESIRKDQAIDEIAFSFNKESYEANRKVTHEIVSVNPIGVLRGVRMAQVTVAPVSYNPQTNTIEVLNNIEVELEFVGADIVKTKQVFSNTYNPMFAPVYAKLANSGIYEDMPDLYKYPVHMLVISDRMFEDALAPWLEWKTQKGFFLDVMYTDEIGSSISDIKTAISDAYNNAPAGEVPCFIQIVGDVAQVPASATGSESGKPTDLYYGSIDGDIWPEIYYSRMSGTNSAHIEHQVEKILYYEKYEMADPTYLDNVLLIAGADGTWNPSVGQPTITYGTNNYFNAAHGFAGVHDYLTSYTGCYENLNTGVGFANYTAHCGETSWGTPSFSVSDVNALTNTNKYFVAVGNCCLSAEFGYGECVGEAFLRAEDKGAVGYIGSSPSSYWYEDMFWAVGAFANIGGGYEPTIAESSIGVYDGSFTDTAYNCLSSMVLLGNLAVQDAHNQGYPTHSSPTYYNQAYNVLGDGSLMTYLTQGEENTVSHMPILPIGVSSFDVSATPGSYAAISKDGELLGAAYIGAAGTVAVPIIAATSGGDAMVVVTRPQYQPYIQTLTCAPLEGPFISVNSVEVEGGEFLTGVETGLTLELKNVGADPSGAIDVTISTDDPELTILDAEEAYPALDPDQTASVDNGFTIKASNNVGNGYVFSIDVEMADPDETWETTIAVTVTAPVLSVEGFVINDEAGNNNGQLDPGETAIIEVTGKNVGGAGALNVTGALISTDVYITVLTTDPQELGDLAAGEEAMVEFSVFAADDTPMGYQAILTAMLFADNSVTVEEDLLLEFGDFCDPSGPNCELGDEIDDFTFASIENLGSGCSPDGYGDFTDMVGEAELGSTHQLTVVCNYDDDYVSMWIDYNSNAEFDDNERVVTDLICVNSGSSYTADVTIPNDVASGMKRLRVRTNWNNSSADPCDNSWSYGETEDYSIMIGTVLPAPQNLEAELVFDDVTFSWEAPEGEDPDGYNLYKNGAAIAEDLQTTSFEEFGLEEGVYTYAVKAIFGAIESGSSNVVPVVVDYTTPQNVQLEVIQSNDITVTWDAVTGKGFVGYNVYRNDDKLTDTPITALTFSDEDLSSGEYCYEVTTVVGAGESSPSTLVCETITSISEEYAGQIAIYPIPADNAVTVEADNLIAYLQIYSITGQLVVEEKPASAVVHINTKSFEQGVYIMKLTINDKTSTRRLIIK